MKVTPVLYFNDINTVPIQIYEVQATPVILDIQIVNFEKYTITTVHFLENRKIMASE
jgi:hypothetical protein